MWDAVVQRKPCAMQRNSAANSSPTISPERHQRFGSKDSRVITRPNTQTRAAAIAERRATCIIGSTASAMAFIATCCAPQVKQRATMIRAAFASTGFLASTARCPAGCDLAVVSAQPTRYKSCFLSLWKRKTTPCDQILRSRPSPVLIQSCVRGVQSWRRNQCS